MPLNSLGFAPQLNASLFAPRLFALRLSDINKFLWMVRIGGSTDTGRHIKEHDYYTPTGEFRVDREGSPVLLNCLMYKMCYYRFGQVYTEASKSLAPPLRGTMPRSGRGAARPSPSPRATAGLRPGEERRDRQQGL